MDVLTTVSKMHTDCHFVSLQSFQIVAIVPIAAALCDAAPKNLRFSRRVAVG